jgi:hypothetical protein
VRKQNQTDALEISIEIGWDTEFNSQNFALVRPVVEQGYLQFMNFFIGQQLDSKLGILVETTKSKEQKGRKCGHNYSNFNQNE